MPMTTRKRSEGGATAVLVAILSVVLFGMAAFAVDLGNAWARKRDLQTSVDLAALAAAAELPDAAAATAAAEDYLTRNRVSGQVTTWDLSLNTPDPRDDPSGYLQFDADGNPWKLRLYAPTARVDYGFAGILDQGDPDTDLPDHADVSTVAAVELRSPGSMLPFFMLNPPSCSFGPQVMKSGPQSGDDDTELDAPASWSPTGVDSNGDFEVTRITSVEVAEDEPHQRILVEGTTKHAVASTAQARVYFDSATAHASVGPISPLWSGSSTKGRYPWSLEVVVPSSVADLGGTWWVRLQRLDTGDFTGQDSAKPFDVEVGADPEDKCGEKNLGDFGLLDSPRSDVTQEKDAFALNTEYGFDHPLAPHPSPGTAGEPCDGSSPDVLDDDSLVEGEAANCVFIENGNKTAWVTLGLFGDYTAEGPDGVTEEHHGRMRHETTEYCQDEDLPAHMTVGDYTDVNADSLECFLQTGTVEAITSPTYSGESVLAPEIFDSPRLIWVPLLNAEANPGHGFYPIVGYRPAFITDIGLNGGGGGVHSIEVIAFHPDALPETVARPESGASYLGVGSKLLRLVQ